MADLYHEPEGHDVIEGMFERILSILENISARITGSAEKEAAPGHSPISSAPAHHPEKPADTMSALMSNLGKQFGVETRAQAINRIDLNQAKVEKEVNLDEIKGRLYNARAGGDPVAEAQANKDLAAARERLQKTVEVVPDKANVGQAFSGAGDFLRVLSHGMHRMGFSEGGSTSSGGQSPPSSADIIPAALRPGEYVLTPEMVSKIGMPFLNRLKDGNVEPVGFAHGGPVGQQGMTASQAVGTAGSMVKNIGKAMSPTGGPMDWVRAGADAIALFVDNVKAFGRHIADMGKATDKFMMSDKAEDMGMAAIEGQEAAGKLGARTMANAIGGPIGGAVLGPIMEKLGENNPVIMFEKALVGTIATIRRWNDQLHESNMKFAQFSSSMAGVQARQTFRDITLSRTRGERRADSAEELASSRHELNERLSVFEDLIANFKNQLLAGVNKMIVGTLDQTPILRDIVDVLRGMMRPADAVSPNEAEMMRNFLVHHRDRTRERLRR